MKPKIESKTWDPILESKIIKKWQNEHIYDFNADKNNFIIDTPPPYPSGSTWHIGAAAHYAQIDMIARTERMNGKNVYFPIGIDRNGLPVEIYTEKKHKIKIQDIKRKEFLKLCKRSLDELEKKMIEIMKSVGMSADFRNYYQTDSDKYRTLTQSTFIELWKKNYIYTANRPNNYDCLIGTTVSDAEIIYKDVQTKLVHIKFKLKKDKNIIVSTTRPELLWACKAIIVNPDDDRYTKFIGKNAIIPLTKKEIKIMAHRSVKKEFGSGAVMICSYGDQKDVHLFRELKLEETITIDTNGKMTKASGKYAGLKVNEARIEIIKELRENGVIDKIEEIIHSIPISERSKVPIQIIPMQEYYLKQKMFVRQIKKKSESIEFYPKMHKQILTNWINSINIDWPISRRRYYGTEIPIWYCKKCSEPYVPEPGIYYRPWKDKCPIDKCKVCNNVGFYGEERILDTWMDSSISPLFISKFNNIHNFFKKTYPTTIRPQAKDIVRTWLYYTLLRCNQITGKNPWKKAWIMGYGVDERGLKMSKSMNNVMDPLPIIKKYGADSFRFWSASVVNHGYDFRCNIDKIESSKKFLSKLWNISRFISIFPVIKKSNMTYTDNWILSELDKVITECKDGYSKYNFFVPATVIREFTWNIFASHYIEMVKRRAYGIGFSKDAQNSAIYTLHRTLSSILKLLAPITPFITDYLWRRLYAKNSIHKELQVNKKRYKDLNELTNEIIKFNSKVWNEKKNKKIPLNNTINIKIPTKLEFLEDDLRSMHNIK